MDRKRKSPLAPSVTFWGAARGVTGSMHQVDAAGQRLLLDCGLFEGKRAEAHRSHAHTAHCGNIPNLVRRGFTGPIYCTAATRALAAVMLGDAAKIQEEDAN